jgi:hypothetical protein
MFGNKKNTLIDCVTLECPICGEVHEVEKRKRNATAKKHGKSIEYVETYYRCINHKVDFVTGKLMDENLEVARNKYQELYG